MKLPSVHAYEEDIKTLENFTNLGSIGQNNGGSHQEVVQQICLSDVVMNIALLMDEQDKD